MIHKKIGKLIDKVKQATDNGDPKSLFSDDSAGGQLMANENRKNDIQQRIQEEMNPTRQSSPPQYGQSSHQTDEEGNQDTLQ